MLFREGLKTAKLTHAYLTMCSDENDCRNTPCLVQECTDHATSCGITGDSTCKDVNTCLKSTSDWSCIEDIAPGQSAANMRALRTCQRSQCSDAEGGRPSWKPVGAAFGGRLHLQRNRRGADRLLRAKLVRDGKLPRPENRVRPERVRRGAEPLRRIEIQPHPLWALSPRSSSKPTPHSKVKVFPTFIRSPLIGFRSGM